MATKKLTTISRYTGLSSETKPTGVPVGSTFREYDTRIMWETYDGTNWKIKTIGSANGDWLFGTPTLTSANNGKARWDRGSTSPLDQKGATGWLANLYGGVQTGDDWARVNIPVNEIPVPQFTEALWTYYMSAAEVYGVNIVIWVHDPDDNDRRAEVTQAPSGATLEKANAWNAHEFSTSTTQMFYFGEIVGTPDTTPTGGTQYTWAQFQTDSIFSTYTIYRVTLEFGWYSTGTFDDAWVADIKLNGEQIPLGPASGSHKKTLIVSKTMVADAKAADDVLSENATTGTDWELDFGGTGYIMKAIITHDAAITDRMSFLLFTRPVGGVVDDNVANDNPLTAEVPFYVGRIDFPALSSNGTGDASTLATPSTVGNLPLAFDAPFLYGVLISNDGVTLVAEALTIALTAEMEDN